MYVDSMKIKKIKNCSESVNHCPDNRYTLNHSVRANHIVQATGKRVFVSSDQQTADDASNSLVRLDFNLLTLTLNLLTLTLNWLTLTLNLLVDLGLE